MSEWQNVKLGEIVTLHYGKALRAQDRIEGDIPVYSSAGITGYHNVPLVMSKGIIIGRKGTVGKVYYSEKPFCCIDTAYYILPNESKYDFIWLYYQLGTIGLEELNEDSAVPGLNRETAYSQEILLPTISEQKAIASILLSLDNKIHLLHRQNKILEDMAETLFRQWFIEEKCENWKTFTLGDVSTVLIGRTPPRKQTHLFSRNDADIKWLSIKDMAKPSIYRTCTEEYLPVSTIKDLKIPIISANTVVLSFKMTVGRVGITYEDMVSNEAIAQFKIQKIITTEFLYCFLKQFNYDSLGTTSTIVTSINTSLINSIELSIPNEEKVINFSNITKPLFEKVKKNQEKIQTLEKLRDTLLPKLMSGEVRVKYTPEAEQ
ncbi:restriction endonuclease subunit S [Providencia vermicola]|uniref:restriction endonuclease subunit S n=1 Tax=Providencia vermicola TaxID=333965 RepID=UPI0034DD8583